MKKYWERKVLMTLLSLLPLGAVAQSPIQRDSTDSEGLRVYNADEVVITATRTPRKLKNTPVITQVITAKEITKKGYADIKALLTQELPGLRFQEVGFGTSIQMQGLDATHILFLVDGERLAGETGNNIDYSRLLLSNIERIEIIKGAASALYGSQAMGGVINIITKEANRKVDISIGGRYAQHNEINYPDLSNNDDLYIYKSGVDRPNLNSNIGVGLHFGAFKSRTSLAHNSKDAYMLYDQKGASYYLPDLKKTVNKEVSKTPTKISGLSDLNISHRMSYDINKNIRLSLNGSYYDLERLDLNIDNKHEQSIDYTWGGALRIIMGETVARLSIHNDTYDRFDKLELLKERNRIYQNKVLQPKLFVSTTCLPQQVISGGIEYMRETLAGDKFATGRYEEKAQYTLTGFLQDEWQVSRDLTLVGGIRGDYHKSFGAHVSPKLAVLWKVFPLNVRFNYTAGYRSPSLKELHMDWDHFGMFHIYGNDQLKPESNHYLSLSGEYISKRLYATLTGYVNRFEQKIEGIWKNDQKELHYLNTEGTTTLSGIEAQSKLQVINPLTINTAISYLHANTSKGVKLTTAPTFSGNIGAEYRLDYKHYHATLSVSGAFMGEKKYNTLGIYEDNGQEIETYFRVEVPSYTIWRISLSQSFYEAINVTCGVENLFDYHADLINFNTSTDPGRRWYVGVNMNMTSMFNHFFTKH